MQLLRPGNGPGTNEDLHFLFYFILFSFSLNRVASGSCFGQHRPRVLAPSHFPASLLPSLASLMLSCISWLDVIQLCRVFGVLLCPACLPPYLTSHLAMFGSFLRSLFRCGQVLRPLLTQPPSPVSAKGILLWALIALVLQLTVTGAELTLHRLVGAFKIRIKPYSFLNFQALAHGRVSKTTCLAPGVKKWSIEVGMACSWDNEGVSMAIGEMGVRQ